ncbi:hypothetical protein ACQPYK_38990 [Streptosporangium sp. CA-135522]|uniref:hypothetical protein n=1 Tax=Streptosporangium sp. CA-135522 TaxID=3240072 RepID=UPI003D91FECC
MLSALSSRRIAVAIAGTALISMTTACGSSDTESCAAAAKLITDYSSSAAANIGDLDKYNAANQKFGEDLKALAAKSSGDLAGALNDFATSIGNFKIDTKDPSALAAAVPEFSKKVTEAGVKIQTACS